MKTLKLLHVKYMPKELDEGILYVSKKYAVSGHLCPCGCRNKVITPLGPGEWSYSEKRGLPSLYPSIGNWQLPCRSHYWIIEGAVDWSYNWTQEQITTGAAREEKRRAAYYKQPEQKRRKQFSLLSFWEWLNGK